MRNLFERINTLFGNWYEGLFGSGGALNPREVLRRLLSVAQEHAIEGLDGAVYVPNRYQIEVTLQDPEQEAALMAFLQPQELAEVVWRELQQEGYRFRGGVVCEVSVRTVEPGQSLRHPVRILARFDPAVPLPAEAGTTLAGEEVTNVGVSMEATDVAGGGAPEAILKREDGTVLRQWSGGAVVIGRSRQAGCDVVIDSDRQISRRHARIEWDKVGGHYLIFDLQSTNGLYVNEQRVDNRVLVSGDRLRLGKTVLLFETVASPPSPCREQMQKALSPRAWLVLHPDTPQQQSFPVLREALIGRALTADVVVQEIGVAMRHAKVYWEDGRWQVEHLGSQAETLLNEQPLPPLQAVPLRSGDILRIGKVNLRFEEEPE